jgi:hypothetical protein
METQKSFENYPLGIVLLSNLVSLSIYGLGFFIIQKSGWIYANLYLLYILIIEFRVIRNHCAKCYYWGKTCCFGKGRISAWIFKRGDPAKFCNKEMSWKDLIPDTLISLIPFVTGIVLIIIKFDFILLSALCLLVLLTTMGNGFIRGTFACKYCKQREIGCPAELFFNKIK